MLNIRTTFIVALATILSATVPVRAQSTYVGANFRATTRSEASGFIPPDTMGAVSGEYVMLLLNGRYELYSKNPGISGIDGVPLAGQSTSLSGFWLNNVGTSGFTTAGGNYAFDPRVTYDPFAQRWYAVSVDGKRSADSGYLFAVSNTSDPRDGWAGFRWAADPDGLRWADFPMLGFDGKYVYISANNYPVDSASSEYPLYALPKSDLLAATPTVDNRQLLMLDSSTNQTAVALDNLSPDVQPYHLWEEGSSSMPFNQIGESGETLESLSGRTYLSNTSFALPSDARQPDGTADLDVDNDRISGRLVRTGGSYWGAFTRKVDGDDVIAWCEIDAVTLAEKQSGIVNIEGQDLFYPSLAVNPDGDVVIGFTASGPGAGQFPSAYAALGSTNDGTTSFASPTLLKAGTHSYHNVSSDRNRWGDYSNTALDPADPNIFWTFQEWASGSKDWSVQVTELITADADEFYWAEDTSGSFSDSARWLPGTAPSTVEHAIFSRSGDAYTVSFSADVTNDRTSVRQGTTTWDLGGNTYRLENPSAATAALAVAEYQGKASLTVTGGVLSTASAAIGTGIGADATMTITGSDTTWISDGDALLGGDNPNGPGKASLTIENGATAEIRGSLAVRPSGNLYVDALLKINHDAELYSDQPLTIEENGTLDVDGLASAPLFTIDGGILSGSGTINGQVIIIGSIISAGDNDGMEALLSAMSPLPSDASYGVTTVPEPGTFMMLLTAAAAVAYLRRYWR